MGDRYVTGMDNTCRFAKVAKKTSYSFDFNNFNVLVLANHIYMARHCL